MNAIEDFSKALKSERGRLCLTQKQLSEKLNIPYGSIRNWESGRYLPNAYIRVLLIYYLERQEVE